MSLFTNPNRIPENYGLRIGGGLIGFFLLMTLLGMAHVVELRLLNVVILASGVYFALKKFKSTHHDHLNYFRGLIMGVSTAGLGSLIFGVFMFIFMSLNPDFMKAIKDNEPLGLYLNPWMASFIILLEGFFSGMLVSFILLNWIDTDEVNEPQG